MEEYRKEHREEYRKEPVKGKMNDTKVIAEPLQSKILKVRNGTVYMVGKNYFTIEKFLKKYFSGKPYIGVISTKLGYALVIPKRNADHYKPHTVAQPLKGRR